MNQELFLLKMGEIVLKGLNRRRFEERLMGNLQRRLHPYGRFRAISRQSIVYVEPLEETCDLDGAWEVLLKNPAKTQRSGAKAALSWSLIKIPSRKIVLCLCCRSALPCFLLLADMKAEAVQTLQLRPDILNRKMESWPDTIRLRSCQFFDNSGRKPGQFLSGDTVAL